MTRNDTPPQMGSTTRTPFLSREERSMLLLIAVMISAALSWYLIITHGPLAFLMLATVVAVGCLAVRYRDHVGWLHGIAALSAIGAVVYGFCLLNAANTVTRHANVVFCSAFRGHTDAGDDVWKIKTERGDFVVQGGLYDGKLSDDDAATHSFRMGSVYLIAYHGGYLNLNDRYMTGAKLVSADGSCGVKR